MKSSNVKSSILSMEVFQAGYRLSLLFLKGAIEKLYVKLFTWVQSKLDDDIEPNRIINEK